MEGASTDLHRLGRLAMVVRPRTREFLGVLPVFLFGEPMLINPDLLLEIEADKPGSKFYEV